MKTPAATEDAAPDGESCEHHAEANVVAVRLGIQPIQTVHGKVSHEFPTDLSTCIVLKGYAALGAYSQSLHAREVWAGIRFPTGHKRRPRSVIRESSSKYH